MMVTSALHDVFEVVQLNIAGACSTGNWWAINLQSRQSLVLPVVPAVCSGVFTTSILILSIKCLFSLIEKTIRFARGPFHVGTGGAPTVAFGHKAFFAKRIPPLNGPQHHRVLLSDRGHPQLVFNSSCLNTTALWSLASRSGSSISSTSGKRLNSSEMVK